MSFQRNPEILTVLHLLADNDGGAPREGSTLFQVSPVMFDIRNPVATAKATTALKCSGNSAINALN